MQALSDSSMSSYMASKKTLELDIHNPVVMEPKHKVAQDEANQSVRNHTFLQFGTTILTSDFLVSNLMVSVKCIQFILVSPTVPLCSPFSPPSFPPLLQPRSLTRCPWYVPLALCSTTLLLNAHLLRSNRHTRFHSSLRSILLQADIVSNVERSVSISLCLPRMPSVACISAEST